MKKTYIIPELEIVKIATQQMLASSATIGLSEETITNEEDLLSRDFDDFDEVDLDDFDEEGI